LDILLLKKTHFPCFFRQYPILSTCFGEQVESEFRRSQREACEADAINFKMPDDHLSFKLLFLKNIGYSLKLEAINVKRCWANRFN
jgi:hypothetical protein